MINIIQLFFGGKHRDVQEFHHQLLPIHEFFLFRHLFRFPFTLRPQELTRVDLRICRFRGDLSVEVGHALKVSEGYLF